MLYLSRITDATVDAFATCGFNVRMRKYASCGPRLKGTFTPFKLALGLLKWKYA